jgi:hypothetical protein
MAPKVGLVNGFVVGVGHYDVPRINFQRINGFNLEASPLRLVIGTFAPNVLVKGFIIGINGETLGGTGFSRLGNPTILKINGLNISSGGFMAGAEVDRVNISVLTAINKMNGISINANVIGTNNFNGICISGIANVSQRGNGHQIAISNGSRNNKDIQVGLFNHFKNLRARQF